jgi:hypothetical protein
MVTKGTLDEHQLTEVSSQVEQQLDTPFEDTQDQTQQIIGLIMVTSANHKPNGETLSYNPKTDMADIEYLMAQPEIDQEWSY